MLVFWLSGVGMHEIYLKKVIRKIMLNNNKILKSDSINDNQILRSMSEYFWAYCWNKQILGYELDEYLCCALVSWYLQHDTY